MNPGQGCAISLASAQDFMTRSYLTVVAAAMLVSAWFAVVGRLG